jgi:hypothetical protein
MQKEFKEQSGNVYENKGPLWKTYKRSLNLYENKGLICIMPEFH